MERIARKIETKGQQNYYKPFIAYDGVKYFLTTPLELMLDGAKKQWAINPLHPLSEGLVGAWVQREINQ